MYPHVYSHAARSPRASLIARALNAGRAWAPLLALLVCALASCAPPPAPPPPPQSPAALRESLRALSSACARDAAEGRARLEALTLSRAEVVALLTVREKAGLEDLPAAAASALTRATPRALALADHYATTLAPRFVEEGCAELARAEQLGWGEVSVERVGPNQGARNAPGDLALLLALPARPALYTARWRAPHKTLGFRVSGFVWAGGRWRALLKLGELLEPWRAEELSRAEARVGTP